MRSKRRTKREKAEFSSSEQGGRYERQRLTVWIRSLAYSVLSSTIVNRKVPFLLALQPHITHKGFMLLIICGRDHWL